jgi:hypothetical protein
MASRIPAPPRACLALTTPGRPLRHSTKLTFPVEPTRRQRETGEAFTPPASLVWGRPKFMGLGS